MIETEITKVMEAIQGVQQTIKPIARSEKADIDGKYSYKFAGMPSIWEVLKPVLKQYDLVVVATPRSSDGQMQGDYLTTTIHHVPSGEQISSTMRLVLRRDDPQAMGAAITYARRYMLASMFGLITEDDDDAKDHRLATAEQKKEWVRAYTVVAKKNNPEAKPTYNDFSKFLIEVYGKGINEILAKDSQSVLDTINAFDG